MKREREQLQKENEKLQEELENRNKVIDHLIDFMVGDKIIQHIQSIFHLLI